MLKDTNYLTILPFMVQDLGLRGSALITYAVVHAFSQDGESQFAGSVGYISKWTGTDERTTRNNLKFLQEQDLIIVQKRPGYTSRYSANPAKLPSAAEEKPGNPGENPGPPRKKDPGTPEKTSGPPRKKDPGDPGKNFRTPRKKLPGDPGKNFRTPRKKLPGTPEKTSDDIDLYIDLEIKKEKDPDDSVFLNEPAKTKEDATVVFNLAREFSNGLKIFPECRDLIIPPAYYDILATLQNYSWAEIQNALKNFHWHNTGQCGPGWKPPPPFRSIYGFLKTGVAQYCEDDTAKALFMEGQKYGVER
jgi:hypothetical protein